MTKDCGSTSPSGLKCDKPSGHRLVHSAVGPGLNIHVWTDQAAEKSPVRK